MQEVLAAKPRSVSLGRRYLGWRRLDECNADTGACLYYSVLANNTDPEIVVWGTLDEEGRPNDARLDYA